MLTCINTYILHKKLIIPCFIVLMHAEARSSVLKKLVGSLLKNESDYSKTRVTNENSHPRFDQSDYQI